MIFQLQRQLVRNLSRRPPLRRLSSNPSPSTSHTPIANPDHSQTISFLNTCLSLDNVLLSWQRNALISTIAGVGVISYRSQSHFSRMMSNRSDSEGKSSEGSRHQAMKPVTGICLLGLGGMFMTCGFLHYAYSLTRVVGLFPGVKGAAGDLLGRFAMHCVVPTGIYATAIGALFDGDVRR